jgi:hypothetical protein
VESRLVVGIAEPNTTMVMARKLRRIENSMVVVYLNGFVWSEAEVDTVDVDLRRSIRRGEKENPASRQFMSIGVRFTAVK